MKSLIQRIKLNASMLFRTTPDNTFFFKIENGDIFSIRNELNTVFRSTVFNETLKDISREQLEEAIKHLIKENIFIEAQNQ